MSHGKIVKDGTCYAGVIFLYIPKARTALQEGCSHVALYNNSQGGYEIYTTKYKYVLKNTKQNAKLLNHHEYWREKHVRGIR